MNNSTIGIVSGYFNPLHAGHIEYITGASEACSYLIAIVNNDIQVKLKGSKEFMAEGHRALIMRALSVIDRVVLAVDKDRSVCGTIRYIRNELPNERLIFFNSGDQSHKALEDHTCWGLGIKVQYLDLPKIYSSSALKEQL